MSKSNKPDPAKKLVQRREFLGGAATMAGASFMGRGAGSTWPGILAATPPDPPPAPEMNAATERKMKRWQEQRWLLDAVVQTVGVEWDQARIAYTLGPCGPDATGDFIGIRSRVRKYNDIAREYTRAAVRREKMARQFEADGHPIAARESYFIAALLYGSAQWPIFEVTRENLALNEKKAAAYAKYMELADHEIRKVEIPFGGNGKSLPGYLHLPLKRGTGKIPAVWAIGGMDSIKEVGVALYGDKLLERGIAVLALEGPGQGECCVREIHPTATNWMQAGPLVLSWLRSQNEIDPDRIALVRREHGLILGDASGLGGRPAEGLRVAVHLPRTRHEHALQCGLAHFQAEVHVHGGLHRRSGIRQIRANAFAEGSRGEDQSSLPGDGRRGRPAQPD